jgi:hypothetical protein
MKMCFLDRRIALAGFSLLAILLGAAKSLAVPLTSPLSFQTLLTMVPEVREAKGTSGDEKIQEVWIKPAPGQPPAEAVKLGIIKSVPAGTRLYHWGSEEDTNRWSRQGFVSPGEVAFLDKGDGAVGGGFYASKDILNSANFGRALSVLTTTQPVNVLEISFDESATSVLSRSAMYQVTNWNEFDSKLMSFGLDGVSDFGVVGWFNMLDAKPLTSIRRATWKDVEESAHFNDANVKFSDFLTINSRIPAQSTPWVQKKFPLYQQLLSNDFDPSTVTSEVRADIAAWLRANYASEDRSPLALAAKKNFKTDVAQMLHQEWQRANGTGPGSSSPMSPISLDPRIDVLRDGMASSRRLEIAFSDWIPGIQEPSPIFKKFPRSDELGVITVSPSGSYAKTLNEHLMYQNLSDTLNAVATGKSIETLYDEPGKAPYSVRWKNAMANFSTSDVLNGVQTLIGKKDAGFRDGPASSEGDIDFNGKKYFKVNPRQKSALESNPYIRSEFSLIDDPKNPGKKIQVARYDYPTAADYERFQALVMDPNLLKDLSEAKSSGLLEDATSPKARDLTRRMLDSIVKSVMLFNMNRAVEIQLFLTSLHPFSEMNAEVISCIFSSNFSSTKLLYSGLRTVPGRPDSILLHPVEDYYAKIWANSDMTSAIQAAFLREEAAHPDFPRYFDVPELWQAGRHVADIGSDPVKFVLESRKEFADPTNCLAGQLKKTLGSL